MIRLKRAFLSCIRKILIQITIIILGLYCIYRIQSCSYPMTEGSIRWDDEDSHNKNGYSGYLPDYDNDFAGVILYYCCHTAGKWYKPIELPTEKPFYLLPYGSRNCQRVKWAVSSLEYIVYDTEDTDNLDEFEGDHVFTDKVESLPKVYYCYYEGNCCVVVFHFWVAVK